MDRASRQDMRNKRLVSGGEHPDLHGWHDWLQFVDTKREGSRSQHHIYYYNRLNCKRSGCKSRKPWAKVDNAGRHAGGGCECTPICSHATKGPVTQYRRNKDATKTQQRRNMVATDDETSRGSGGDGMVEMDMGASSSSLVINATTQLLLLSAVCPYYLFHA